MTIAFAGWEGTGNSNSNDKAWWLVRVIIPTHRKVRDGWGTRGVVVVETERQKQRRNLAGEGWR
jgi:hypothetical protein